MACSIRSCMRAWIRAWMVVLWWWNSLEVWESVSSCDGLRGDTSNSNHGQSSIHELCLTLLGESLVGLWHGHVPSEVTWLTVSLGGGSSGWGGDDEVEETNPEGELVHWSGLEESIVGIDGLWDGLEGVHLAWDADEVGGDETNDGQHGGTSVTQLALTEPWEEWLVSLGELQRIVLEFLAAEVEGSVHLIHGGLHGNRSAGWLSAGESTGGGEEGEEGGGGLHGGG
mmetsp:Transcript_19767/g.54975  ORF Transcript_19767/g.54975 Transcript_19767/m.54975 type:complete len:227 (-) Transcript_19767:34-714(-)